MFGIEFLDKKHVIASQGMNGVIKDTYEISYAWKESFVYKKN